MTVVPSRSSSTAAIVKSDVPAFEVLIRFSSTLPPSMDAPGPNAIVPYPSDDVLPSSNDVRPEEFNIYENVLYIMFYYEDIYMYIYKF